MQSESCNHRFDVLGTEIDIDETLRQRSFLFQESKEGPSLLHLSENWQIC